eukprot:TRINITY_DN43551_c0_g1_i1.p1 TRINITY_DN43551_c0_g1~~TRINITY_DN43551_c0_g1_i1.p1  ORF type:complete len:474 (-),score=83.86 TRINITY_DN43551_c0_g1_i1:21-1271(-)
MVNSHSVFFATKHRVSTLHEGLLTPVIEVHDAEITAFHLCHHRSSLFYETLSHEGGVLTIYEYSLSARESVKVRAFQETVPATALACVDQLLLRASPASLLAVDIQNGLAHTSVLQKFTDPEGADSLASLAVGFAADVISQAQVYAVAPGNRSLLRLHLQEDSTGLLRLASTEQLLGPGSGADGPLSEASALAPQQVAWDHGKVVFVDGCSIRQAWEGRAFTLLGTPGACSEPGNETLQPAVWDSKLSRLLALASEAEATQGGAVLALSAAQVIHVSDRSDDACSAHSSVGEAACLSANGCAWAKGQEPDQLQCFSCSALQEWAAAHRPALEACSLESSPRTATRYNLEGCGCAPPAPEPANGGGAAGGIQAFLSVLTILVLVVVAVYMYRARRRANLRELYGVDTAEFPTFTDDC